jgi:hypothetical protein
MTKDPPGKHAGPKSPKAAAKPNPRPEPTKAERAAQKRLDKTVIKRMRKI